MNDSILISEDWIEAAAKAQWELEGPGMEEWIDLDEDERYMLMAYSKAAIEAFLKAGGFIEERTELDHYGGWFASNGLGPDGPARRIVGPWEDLDEA